MNFIKLIVKKTPLIQIWRRVIRYKKNKKTMFLNGVYKRNIDPLLDEKAMETVISNFKISERNCKYIISLKNERIGIFGYINFYLPHIAYAISKGYVPIIDMQNYRSIYQKNDENAWENFFEQPSCIGLQDVNDNFESAPSLWYRWGPNSCPLMSDKEIRMWGSIYKKFVRYNSKTKEYLQNELSTILLQPEKTVGVIYRGTDYTQGHPIGHPIQPSMKNLADKVEEMMQTQNCDYIYLASDEKGIVDYMNGRFPGKVLINKRVYYDLATNVDYSNYNKDHIGVSGAVFNRENNEYLIGIEYISSINLVAHCACLVAGACGGTTAALYMNNLRYREKYIFNLGKYGFDSEVEEEQCK